MINEDEIKELLNLKLEELDSLDLDEEDGGSENKSSSVSKQGKEQLNNFLSEIPAGEEGFQFLNDAEFVKNTESKISKLLQILPSGEPFKNSFTQIGQAERTVQYKEEILKNYQQGFKKTMQIYARLSHGQSLSYKSVSRIVEPFVDLLATDSAMVQNLSTFVMDENDYLFHHLMRVCMLSINIGAEMGLSKEQILELGSAALLADVGMTLISSDIRTKRGRLSAEELYEVQKHPVLGLYALEKIDGIPPQVTFVAYQHHERCSGVGYPKRRKKSVIHPYSRIVAICDVFEALCSERTYRIPYNPSEAMKKVVGMGEMGLLDAEIIEYFAKCVSRFPVGCLVQLNDKTLAKVVQANPENINRPVVSKFTSPNGRYLETWEMQETNLLNVPDLKIEKALDFKIKHINLMSGF